VRFILWVLANALALGAAVWLLDGITIEGDSGSEKFWTLIGVALIFGLVNATVGPIVKLLSLPFIVLTLGLLLIVINAALLMLTSWIAGDVFDLGFNVDDFFWTAIWGGIIISIASTLISIVTPRD
jgi:putative membrane protein